jgi:hypothetical protein
LVGAELGGFIATADHAVKKVDQSGHALFFPPSDYVF